MMRSIHREIDQEPQRIVGGLSDSRAADVARQTPRLPRFGRDVAEAASGDSTRWSITTSATTPTSIAASTRSPRVRPMSTREHARRSRASSTPTRSEIVWMRNTTEAINLVAYSWGLQQLKSRRRDPDLPSSNTTPTSCRGSCWRSARAPSCVSSRSTSAACSCSTISTRCSTACKLVALAHVSNTLGTIVPLETIVAARTRRGRHRARGRRARRAASAGRRSSARCRLLCVQRTQDARPDRNRRALRQARAARSDAAVPLRRRHDPQGRIRRARRSPSCPGKFEAGTSNIADAIAFGVAVDYLEHVGMDVGARARARADGVRARTSRRVRTARPRDLRSARSRTASRASSRSTSPTSTRTTWRRSSIPRASACAPDTTARCR